MRFNPELMRKVLLIFEEAPAGRGYSGFVQIEGFEQGAIDEMTKVLLEEGYFNGQIRRGGRFTPQIVFCSHLTMKAHEFLANARNNTIWKKVLAKAESEGLAVSVSILNGLLEKAAKKYAGLE